jgi:hypothetical protein
MVTRIVKVNFVVLLIAVISIIFLIGMIAIAGNFTKETSERGSVPVSPMMQSKASHNYEGRIRIYIVEPTSRWVSLEDYKPYQFGFLDWGYDTTISLPYGDSLVRTITWDAVAAGFDSITENNIMVMAVAFNSEVHQGYSDPPAGYPFDAYYVDATAAAKVDSQWADTSFGTYTHTAFIEEGTRTSCPYCPNTRKALWAIYQLRTYPMFYAAMVRDSNIIAHNRLVGEMNLGYVPTTYFDGGHNVLVGGYLQTGYYTPLLQSSLNRAVHDIDMSVSLTWLGNDQIQMNLNLKNNEFLNSSPNPPLTPIGIDTGLINRSYQFSSIGTDPEEDRYYVRYVWDAGDTSIWLGPYEDGDTCRATHTWSAGGTYSVLVQCKDEYQSIGDWSAAKQVRIFDYVAGDADHSGIINILDVTRVINYLYKGGAAPNPLQAGDANGNGALNVQDVTYLINYLYKGGPAPKYPAS